MDQVFLLDPLLATGGTVCAALTMITEWGIAGIPQTVLRHFRDINVLSVKDIKLLCVLASEDGLKHVQAEYPELEVSGMSVRAEDLLISCTGLGRRR